jgi:hypothetical protein
MQSSSRTVIDHPADRIDLAQWLSKMTDREYQACSRAYRAAGTFREGGTFGMVNVESIGGHLLVQHYLAKKATAHHVLMHSTNTLVYIMHVLPATIEVFWTLGIEPRDSHSAEFTCTVEARMPTPLDFVARLRLLPLFLDSHSFNMAIPVSGLVVVQAPNLDIGTGGQSWRSRTTLHLKGSRRAWSRPLTHLMPSVKLARPSFSSRSTKAGRCCRRSMTTAAFPVGPWTALPCSGFSAISVRARSMSWWSIRSTG